MQLDEILLFHEITCFGETIQQLRRFFKQSNLKENVTSLVKYRRLRIWARGR